VANLNKINRRERCSPLVHELLDGFLTMDPRHRQPGVTSLNAEVVASGSSCCTSFPPPPASQAIE
jgi:hypothetical protein